MKKLLIIDDETSAVAAIRRILLDLDYEIHGAFSPEEGLAKAKEVQPDGVICDYHMPGMNGVELLSILRERDPDQEQVRILLTAGVDKNAMVSAINRAGIDYFLQKPVDHSLLVRVLEKGFAYQDLLASNRKLSVDLKVANNRLLKINSELELEVRRRAGEIMEREFHLRKVVGEISTTIEGVIRNHLDSEQFAEQLTSLPQFSKGEEREGELEQLRRDLEKLIRSNLLASESGMYKALVPGQELPKKTREPLDEVWDDFSLMLKLLDYKQKSLEMTNLGLEELVREKTSQLLHTERMASIGLMASGVAHEINNPNAVIRANVQLLRKFRYVLMSGQELEEHFVLDEMDSILDRVDRNSRRIETIVSGLRQFSRKEPSAKEPVEVISCIEDALVLTQNSLKNHVTLEQRLPISLPMVYASSQELVQVFVNLILNGVHACEEHGGTLTVEAFERDKELHIVFEDDGVGVPKEIQQRIFEPFFTTKEPQKGVGLGLSISKGIIESFGGTIGVTSKDGEGARFLITLPQLVA